MMIGGIRVGLFAVGLGMLAGETGADQLRVRTADDWRQWAVPGNAVKIEDRGVIPAFTRHDVDAVTNAAVFGGGLRGVGSRPSGAADLIDGDARSFWAPDMDDPLEDWWIEVDLGRVVSARRIRLLFAESGKPLEFFQIFTSDGEPFFTNANTIIPGTVLYNKRTLYSFNEEYAVEVDFHLKPLRYIRIQADRKTSDTRLSELQVETVGDNLSLGITGRGGGVEITSESLEATELLVESAAAGLTLIDGDINTFWGIVGLNADFTWFEIDLGGLYWVDRVRILGDVSGISPSGGWWRRRARATNFLWYILYGSDGSLAPDGTLRWEILGELPSDQKNLQGVVHFEERFPLQKLRYFKLFFPQQNVRAGTTAEFQIFGEGHPAKVVLTSPIYDLKQVMNASAVEWSADVPDQTRLEIRSRTGNLLDEEIIYRDKGGKEITEKRWNKLIPSFRGSVDTLFSIGPDWNPWSRVYETSGQRFLSPGPRQYAQLEARLFSDDPFSAVRLEELILHFHSPLARQSLGEIYPTQVDPGVFTRFTYYLRSLLDAGDIGFDQIWLQASTSMEFAALRVDGEEQSVFVQEEGDGSIRLIMEQPVSRSSLVEIDFGSEIFLSQTRFSAYLASSRLGAEIRQPVDPGDASETVESEVVFVSLPVGRGLVGKVSLSSSVLTPNGDGIGDRLEVEFDLLKVLEPRPVRGAIYDLSGRKVCHLREEWEVAGRMSLGWDGRRESGKIVAPGIYILRIEVAGDARKETVTRLISVVY
ncbi:MAG: discoidin domain-containing protein [Gemmatimonadetes bacterium]|jgi:hypothetical protein|nr:discoidin domain-containing protein [Gemmatimonadota bacterium]